MPGSDDEEVEDTPQQKRNRQRRANQQTFFLNEQRRMVRQTIASAQVEDKVQEHLNFEARSFVLFLVTFVLGVIFSVPGIEGLSIVEGTTNSLISKNLPSSVASSIEKNFHDTNSLGLLQNWLEHILHPAMYSSDSSGYLNDYNRVLGGVRIRQIRVQPDESCSFDAGGFIGIKSYSGWSAGGILTYTAGSCRGGYGAEGITEDKTSFGSGTTYTWRSASENNNEVFGTDAKLKSYKTDVYYPGSGFTIDLGTDGSAALATIQQFSSSGWYDQAATAAIIVEFSTYNPSSYLHQTVRLLWERTSAGELIMSDQIDLTRIYRYPKESAIRMLSLVLDAINTAYIIYFLYAEILLLFHPNINEVLKSDPDPDEKKSATYQEKVFEPLPYWKRPFYYWLKLRDGWEIIHLLNVVIFAVVLSANIEWYLTSAVFDYTLSPTDTTFQNLAPLAQYYSDMKQLNAFNLLLSFLKLFKFMKLSATLNVLWLTLTKAGVFLFGYVAILFLVYFGFDFQELSERSSLCAPIFYFMYLFLVFFVMLNLFIAILSNSFKEVVSALEANSKSLQTKWLPLMCDGDSEEEEELLPPSRSDSEAEDVPEEKRKPDSAKVRAKTNEEVPALEQD